MNNLAKLKSKFGDQKRFTKLVAVRNPCQLGFIELLLYSTLIFRGRESGCTASTLALLTGCHESVTIPKALARLAGFNLVVQSQDKRWVAKYPPEDISDWFVLRPAELVANQYRYNWIMVPAYGSPLTTLQAAIIPSLVLGKSWRAIARFIRVSLRTVSRTVKLLQDNDNKFRKDWFQDKGKVVRRKAPSDRKQLPERKVVAVSELLGVSDPYLIKQLDRNNELMRKDGIKEVDIAAWWQQVIGQFNDPNGEKVEGLLYAFPQWFGKIQTDHKHNRKQGLTDYANCYRLMLANVAAFLR